MCNRSGICQGDYFLVQTKRFPEGATLMSASVNGTIWMGTVGEAGTVGGWTDAKLTERGKAEKGWVVC